MFQLRRKILSGSLSSNSFVVSHPTNLDKSYSPMNISNAKLSPRRSQTQTKIIIRIKPLKKVNKPIAKKLNIEKPSIMKMILDYKSKISAKYTRYFLSVILSEQKIVEYEDIMNYLRVKQYSKEIRRKYPDHHENINHLARCIIQTFDLHGKLSFGIQEFLAVCSVHDMYFSNIPMSLLNINLLSKLQEKIEELRKKFEIYLYENQNKTDYIFSIVKTSVGQERNSIIGFLKSSNINFSLYLQVLPILLTIKN